MQMYLVGFSLLLLQPNLDQKLRSEGFLPDRMIYPWAPLFLLAVEVGANPPKRGAVTAVLSGWGVGGAWEMGTQVTL